MKNGRVLWSIVAAFFVLSLAGGAFAQISQMSLPEDKDYELLDGVFRSAEEMRGRFRSMEFKEQLSFRLAGVVRDGKSDKSVDFRQSADYAVTLRPGQPAERKFLQAGHVPQFDVKRLLSNVDVPGIQETLPQIVTLQTALLGFVSKDNVSGCKELGKDKVNKKRAVKLALRFRTGRFPVEECILWIDEKTHAPLKAAVRIGDIGRYGDVRLLIFYEGDGLLPESIHQEMACVAFDGGFFFRIEHNSVYSDFKPLPLE